MIGDDVKITVVDVRGDKVRLGISAPKEIPVHRIEIYEAIQREKREKKAPEPAEKEPPVAAEEEPEEQPKKVAKKQTKKRAKKEPEPEEQPEEQHQPQVK